MRKVENIPNLYADRSGTLYYAKMIEKKREWVNLETTDTLLALSHIKAIKDNPLLRPDTGIKGSIKEYLAYKKDRRQFSRASLYNKENVLNLFASWLPDSATVSNVTHKKINDYYHYLRKEREWTIGSRKTKGVSESTAESYMMVLRSFFRWACEVKRARLDNPVKKVDFAKVSTHSKNTPWVRVDLKNKLIEGATSKELKFILFCGFDVGLRREEIVEVRKDWFLLDDVNLKEKYYGALHVTKAEGKRLRPGELPFLVKDREERTIPLTKEFYLFIKDYIKGLDPLDYVLYPGIGYGKWRYRYDFRRPFQDYMTANGCSWVTPHTMRRSFCSILASKGVSLLKIAEWTGDKEEVIQNRYAHLCPKDKDIHFLSSGKPSARNLSQQASTSLMS